MSDGFACDAVIRLTTRSSSSLLSIERSFDGAVFDLPLHRPDLRLIELRRSLPLLLDRIRMHIGRKQMILSDPQIVRAVAQIERLAFGLLDTMLDDSGMRAGEVMPKMQEFLAPIFHGATAESRDPIVELEASIEDGIARLFPFEFLPLAPPLTPICNERDRFETFLGFRAQIVRFLRKGPDEIERDHTGRIPVHVFAYSGDDFPGIIQQLGFLRREATITARWPLPEGVDDEFTGVSSLAGALISLPALSARGAIPCIAHFSCHYKRAGADAGGQYWPTPGLDFGVCNNGAPLAVPIFDLRGELERQQSGRPPIPFAAFFFLNACESVATDGVQESLFGLLRGRNATALVGSETLLPDLLAAQFAISFYTELLRTVPASLALLNARRNLLQQYSNPVGLFYTFLGNPLLHVTA